MRAARVKGVIVFMGFPAGADRWIMTENDRMTDALFRQDAYLRETPAKVIAIDANGIVLDRTVFYPRGGGQAGDAGLLRRADGLEIAIADTVKGEVHDIVHVPA